MKVELNKVFEINGSVENTWVFSMTMIRLFLTEAVIRQ